MRIQLILLIGLAILSLSACKSAEQEVTIALQKACGDLVNKVQVPVISIPQATPSTISTIDTADQGPRNIWEAAELARTW